MLAKQKKTIGIDLGSHSVKAIQLSHFGTGMKVDKALLVNLDSSSDEARRIESTTRALRNVASAFDTRKCTIVTALPGQDTFIRYLRFPKMPPDELKNSIELEADQNLPYDLAEVSMDSVVLEEITERAETIMKILLVAAKNEMINNTMHLLQGVGLFANVLGVTTLAISDAFEINGGFKPDETVALVNIGASSTNIHFCRDGVSNFTRDILRGGRDLTAAIQKLLKLGFDEAERMKIEYSRAHAGKETDLDFQGAADEPPQLGDMLPDTPSDDFDTADSTEPMAVAKNDDASRIVNATRPALNRLIGEIRRSIDYYEKQLYEKNVNRLVLSGGTAMYPGLDQALADATGVPVEIFNPVQALIVEEDSREVKDLIENRAQFNVAVGLAARGIEQS
ncbi:MAG: type IV pilus assembly protein PilM [Candidatus Abyssubacteria bacterium]